MKAFFVFLFSAWLLVSCHRKSVPSSSDNNSSSAAKGGSTVSGEVKKPATTATSAKAIIVVDGNGKLTASKETLLANGAKSGFPTASARSFTPQQRANLIARFKTVPPRVLHVPDQLAKKAAQGQYYVLRNKFWYWKKSDGFYYLDDNYYE